MRVAYLGPPGTYSHEAALQVFEGEELLPQATLTDVVKAIQNLQVDAAVVPVENSTDGIVGASLDALAVTPRRYYVVGETRVHVANQLYSCYSLNEITKVYTHPQVWGQVEKWLSTHLPGVERVDSSSTSRAMYVAKNEPYAAAIAGQAAGMVHRMTPLADISDNKDNTTRFWVLMQNTGELEVIVNSFWNGVRFPSPSSPGRTIVTLRVKDSPGALANALAVFGSSSINLTFLCPRPASAQWSYVFFVEFVGLVSDPVIAKAIEQLKEQAHVEVLGCIPSFL